jgi:hypothetical protein
LPIAKKILMQIAEMGIGRRAKFHIAIGTPAGLEGPSP